MKLRARDSAEGFLAFDLLTLLSVVQRLYEIHLGSENFHDANLD